MSVPHIPLIPFDLMSPEQSPEFILKAQRDASVTEPGWLGFWRGGSSLNDWMNCPTLATAGRIRVAAPTPDAATHLPRRRNPRTVTKSLWSLRPAPPLAKRARLGGSGRLGEAGLHQALEIHATWLGSDLTFGNQPGRVWQPVAGGRPG